MKEIGDKCTTEISEPIVTGLVEHILDSLKGSLES